MAVKKISISLDAEILERAKRAASAEGVALSTWLSHAAEEAAVMAEAREVLVEYIAMYGEAEPEAMAETRARFDAAGIGGYESAEETAARLAALERLRGAAPYEPQRRAG